MPIYRICPGCQKSIEPLEKIKTDKKKKTWIITYCPREGCGFNIDIEPMNVKVWNDRAKYFEDLTGDEN